MALYGEFIGDGLAAHHAGANGVGAVRLNVFDIRKMDAVFVAKRQIGEQVLERVNAALGEKLGALRADAFDHADFGLKADGHSIFLYIIPAKTRCSRNLRACACVSIQVGFCVAISLQEARGGRPVDRFGQARAAAVDNLRYSRRGVCAEIFFPRVSGSVGGFQGLAQRGAQRAAISCSLGENVNGYQSSITFEVDDNAKTYLERELGLQEANRLMS